MPKRNLNESEVPHPKRAKQLNVKAALNGGSLLAGVTLEGLQVILSLKTPYNQARHYKAINRILSDLYRTSLAFREKFERPNAGNQVPTLQLKENHGYLDETAVLTALKEFASPQKRLNAKAALREGSLLASVTLEGLQATLDLQTAYNQASYYKIINKALYKLYQVSSTFQAQFERPMQGHHHPVLWLKEDHCYVDGNAVLNALKAFATPHQKSLNVKAALREGNLLGGVTLEGLQATLNLQTAYNQASCYKAINHALYNMYQISSAFQARFERPNTSSQVPVLQLKEDHGYADGNAILVALREFAAPEKPLNIKAALREGNLLEGVTLEGLQATLVLQTAYNQASCYKPINQTFSDLYYTSLAFQAKFERPNAGNQLPVLRLREGHHYVDGEMVLTALIDFAKGKIDEPLSESTNMAQQDLHDPIDARDKQISNLLMTSSEQNLIALLNEQLSKVEQIYQPSVEEGQSLFWTSVHFDQEQDLEVVSENPFDFDFRTERKKSF